MRSTRHHLPDRRTPIRAHHVKILPRKSEIDAVSRVLASDEYESAEAMSREIVRVVWDEISKRDSFLVHMTGLGERGLIFGPLLYSDEAKRFCASLPGAQTCFKVHSAATQIERIHELDRLEKERAS